jgi:hypothetical protein
MIQEKVKFGLNHDRDEMDRIKKQHTIRRDKKSI